MIKFLKENKSNIFDLFVIVSVLYGAIETIVHHFTTLDHMTLYPKIPLSVRIIRSVVILTIGICYFLRDKRVARNIGVASIFLLLITLFENITECYDSLSGVFFMRIVSIFILKKWLIVLYLGSSFLSARLYLFVSLFVIVCTTLNTFIKDSNRYRIH